MPDELRYVKIALGKILYVPIDWHLSPIDWVNSKMCPNRLGKHLNKV